MITQTVFNTIFLGLKAQEFRQAIDLNTTLCRFRDNDGNKCAIGQMIPNDDYASHMENWGINEFHQKGMFLDLTLDEFSELQCAHDDTTNPDRMEQNFRELAGKYGLEVPV